MATEDDVKREKGEEEPEQDLPADELPADAPFPADAGVKLDDEIHDVAQVGAAASPSQLGTQRFVYAAYFAGAIGIAFLMSKILGFAWFKAQGWKPWVGEPRDEVVMPLSALIGALAAVYYWYRTRARRLAEEVATEMSKVTWPSRKETLVTTGMVFMMVIACSIFFVLVDLVFTWAAHFLLGIGG